MKDDDEIRNLLQSKYDRETLMAVSAIRKKLDIDEILNNCSYSEEFYSDGKRSSDLRCNQ